MLGNEKNGYCAYGQTFGQRAMFSCLKVREKLFDHGKAPRRERLLQSQESCLLQFLSFTASA